VRSTRVPSGPRSVIPGQRAAAEPSLVSAEEDADGRPVGVGPQAVATTIRAGAATAMTRRIMRT
jgi:hypothetical protein